MKFQVLLLAFALVIATNIHCQAQPQLRDSDKSPEVSRRQVRTCNCSGRRFENCPCELKRHSESCNLYLPRPFVFYVKQTRL
ncbi:uncharacterized protein zgc:158701 [Rhinichthys klamathensis goyatoka]|uniref:uncharacterized protein zgc:158701 n=1 Tax=Rhinichthys klamathensis goyatoka TaxID=3034132 RepID=UPI0024B5DB08|nr:uncharacterized protein zgc:158701 [Rhinichthys klamathensis goyatoka]